MTTTNNLGKYFPPTPVIVSQRDMNRLHDLAWQAPGLPPDAERWLNDLIERAAHHDPVTLPVGDVSILLEFAERADRLSPQTRQWIYELGVRIEAQLIEARR